jgi:CBS domain-containing protein
MVRRPEVKQNMTGAPAQKSPSHSRAAAATVIGVMRPPLTTAGPYDHVAAAAYLMKHRDTTALMVVNEQTGQPAGIITQADVARTIADGKNPNDVRVYAAMITRPVISTTTSLRHAAEIMTARRFRHLPVAGDAGLLGVIDVTDVCRALSKLETAG